MKLKHEFIHDADAPHDFEHKIGTLIASSLSGFIAGTIFASIVWILGIYLFRLYFVVI